MWGGLTVCALRLALRLDCGKIMTAAITGMLIVSMDILLDVAAIRLDGGFWTWEGRAITTDITHHMFMSVIWVNFLGYMFETPMITWLALKDGEKGDNRTIGNHALAAVFNALAGIVFVGIMSLLSLWLNTLTDEWFSCIGFILIWAALAILLAIRFFNKRHYVQKREILSVVFFASMYVYCFAALFHLGIFKEAPWFLFFGLVLFLFTAFLGISGSKSTKV